MSSGTARVRFRLRFRVGPSSRAHRFGRWPVESTKGEREDRYARLKRLVLIAEHLEGDARDLNPRIWPDCILDSGAPTGIQPDDPAGTSCPPGYHPDPSGGDACPPE